MLRSLSAQVSFYSSMIQNHKSWNYACVYSDEAITGTKEARESFQRQLNDCRNGKIVINESEAKVVRHIFSLYLSGVGTTKISKILKNENISSPCGSSWSAAALRETLKNEKYTGNMMLQKYYAEDTHPAIISHSDFDKAQMLFAERTKDTDFKRYDYNFKGMVFCGCCGWRYRRKKNYKKYVWRCATHA